MFMEFLISFRQLVVFMIRIPFSDGSQAYDPDGPMPREDDAEVRSGRELLESRMVLLESKLSVHAEDLRESVVRRVERIESRVSRALTSLGSGQDTPDPDNVVEFAEAGRDLHHLPAVAAVSALNELNATLELTRNHLDALDASVDRMRTALRREA